MKEIYSTLLKPGVWKNTERYPRFSTVDAQRYVSEVHLSPTKRARVCMHSRLTDQLQEMFIAFDGTSYIRPSYHVGRAESIHIMQGICKYIFFDIQGNHIHDVRLGPYAGDLPFYCRIPADMPHSLVILSHHAFAHEVCIGPFEREKTIFPAWAAECSAEHEQIAIRQALSMRPVEALQPCQFEHVGDGYYRVKEGISYVARRDLDDLKSRLSDSVWTSVELSMQPNEQADLQEKFVVAIGPYKVRPRSHPDRDVSFHILEGQADCVLFDDHGLIREVISLGDGNHVYVRVPRGVFYSLIRKCPCLVIHEATSGPVHAGSEVWAPWAQSDANLDEQLKQFARR